VLQTWGSALTHHPQALCIVLGGGLSPDGSRWIACRRGLFLPVRVLSHLFRRLILEWLLAAHAADRLALFGDLVHLADPTAFKAHLKPLWLADWVVYAKRPFAGPERVCATSPLHPPRGHRQQSADRLRWRARDVQGQGLTQG
jgi:hypothetical protein